MKISKVEVKRFVVKWDYFRYTRYGHLPNVVKNRPLRKNDDEKIYKLYQCTEVSLDYTDICELKTRTVNPYDSFCILDETLIDYIREQLNDQDVGFFDLHSTFAHLSRYECKRICDNKQGEVKLAVIMFNEDAELITNYTPKEERMRVERKRLEVNQQIYNSLILPTLQSALAEFKLSVNEEGVYLLDQNADDFIKVAFMKLVLPRCEELGLDIEPLQKRLSEIGNRVIRFKPIDFKLKENKND